MQTRRLTAILEREGDVYVALCPEVDVASQGTTIEEAKVNLIEALTLFFESADAKEVAQRLTGEILVTQVEIPVG
jgi:predicted RNase H-like HicB family nuclease